MKYHISTFKLFKTKNCKIILLICKVKHPYELFMYPKMKISSRWRQKVTDLNLGWKFTYFYLRAIVKKMLLHVNQSTHVY